MPPDAGQSFNFASPGWLWGLALLPLLWLLYALFFREKAQNRELLNFADAHLLPHLLADGDGGAARKKGLGLPLAAWSVIFALGLVAMAGPRWDYTELKAFSSTRNLVILLDLSKSMDAQDVKPSRLTRAREEIEDIAQGAKAVNIGFIVFDSVPHMITPLTDDRQTLIHLLPSFNTGLSYISGHNLAPALDMARGMLASAPGSEKNVLVISDGGFDDGDAAIYRAEKKLTEAGARIHVMGVGTKQGAPVRDKDGFIQKDGATQLFRIDEDRLRRIASDGNGIYTGADYFDNGTRALLSEVERPSSSNTESGKTTRFWDERFYVFLFPALLLLLPWFRRNAAFPLALVLLLSLPGHSAQAFEWRDLFLNKDQQGQKALEDKQYGKAEQKFDDPYRRGVAQYRAGNYDEAAKSFAASKRPDVTGKAEYNLGNAQLMAGKVQDAINTYEDVLKKDPGNDNAKHNLEIAKKLLEQQQQQSSDKNQKQDQNQQQSKNDKQNQSKSQQDQNQKQGQDQQQNQANNSQDKQQQDKQQQQNQQSPSSQQQKQAEQQKQDQQSAQQQQKQQEQQDKQNQSDQQQEQQHQQKQDQQSAEQQQKQQAQQDKQNQSAQEQKQDEQKQAEQQKQDQTQQQQQQEAQQKPEGQQGQDQQPENQQQGQPHDTRRTARDVNADQWLDRIQNDPESFLKNKFYIETMRQSKKGAEETP